MSIIRGIMLPVMRNSRLLTQVSSKCYVSSKSDSAAGLDATKVPGLSKKVVDVPNKPVGPGAAKDKPYKNPEYFCYNTNSYFEAEVEMAKYRLPQPSSKAPQ